MFSDLPYSSYLAANTVDTVGPIGIPCKIGFYWSTQLGRAEFNRFILP